MRRLLLFVLTAALGTCAPEAAAPPPPRVELTLLSTTDLHGNVYPVDYATGMPDERGLAKLATLIRGVRAASPHVLLLNTGDTLPGTALAYYQATQAAGETPPVIAAMNALRFDAMVLGNHEYDFGWPLMLRAAGASRFPWLAANASPPPGGQSFYRPYAVREVAGIRVAILGLTTTAIPNWYDPAAERRRIVLSDPLSAARRWVPLLRQKEHADVVVAAMHMGLEENPETGVRASGQTEGENLALAIARQVPGIDVILMGHTHRAVDALVTNGVLLIQPAAWGRSLARADLTMESRDGHWQVAGRRGALLPVTGVAADPEILRLAAPLHAATQAWLDRPIAVSARDFAAGPERFQPSALLDFVHQTQLEAGRADVSLTESLSPTARISAGRVTVRQLFGLYTVEKKVVTLAMTGAQLRAVLEQSARYFRGAQAGQPPETWVDRDFPAYNYYMAYGVDYDLDADAAPGHRIANLRFRGRPLRDEETLRVATSHYLANGTAEYGMMRDARVVARSAKDLRQLLVEALERRGTLPETPRAGWRLLPAAKP